MAKYLIAPNPKKPHVIRRGVLYFKNYSHARSYARETLGGTPWEETHNLLSFVKGWAIQLHKSGPYLGPDTSPHSHACAWCPK